MNIKSILEYFPNEIEQALILEIKDDYEYLEEIRLRALRPIILKYRDEEKIIKYNITTEDLLNILAHICENSIYSYQNEIANRFCNYKGWAQNSESQVRVL